MAKNHQHDLITDVEKIGEDFCVPFLQHCFIYLVTETVGDYPYPYFTEKTWKAVISKMPFLFVGAKHSLKKLQDFGFKTFSDWWDESYDAAPTVAQRIDLLMIELKKLSSMSLQQQVDLRKEMQSILDHNHDHLAAFIESDLDNIKKNL